jgi:alpha-1,6-mannosyltransferase
LDTDSKTKNNFFNSVWIVFLLLFLAYSVYILIESPELAKINNPTTTQIVSLVSFKIILGVYFFIAVINIKKILDKRIWLPLIVFVGLVSRVILIPSTPVLEDDFYRYLWDGAVIANGINPFKYSPLEVEKDSLQVLEELIHLKNKSGEVFENINHRHIRSIYPMFAQATFGAAYFISPWQTWAWKLVLFLFDILLLFILFRLLKYLKLPLIFISFYWLNPIVLHEFYSAAHMDLLALPFVILSLFFVIKKKSTIAIILLFRF